MTTSNLKHKYTASLLQKEAAPFFALLRGTENPTAGRTALFNAVSRMQYWQSHNNPRSGEDSTVRDCARALRGMFHESADSLSGFSLIQALTDLAKGVARPDLTPAFYADLYFIFRGLNGKNRVKHLLTEDMITSHAKGRPAAIERSDQLDKLWGFIERETDKYPNGLLPQTVDRRLKRKASILQTLGAVAEKWDDWHWQTNNIQRDPERIAQLVNLTEGELTAIRRAREERVPFGITPYYLSLMDNDYDQGRDRAIRRQVIPPGDYLDVMKNRKGVAEDTLDFMLERDTSPIDLITRRYPSIVILKPFNTCPQICVYCQRNWEIDDAMAPHAFAGWEKIHAACDWIAQRPAIKEVLITGGDPMALNDKTLDGILKLVAGIPSVELIRIGTRIPVTMPMRITEQTAMMLGKYRVAGRRELILVTHVEHPYEVTPEMVLAVDRLKRQGITVLNQLVYTFYVSRRFEAVALRSLLRRCGIEPYYTFAPKGKDETASYRVPIARILQEQKEEARMLPGSRRTDEAVYNIPGLGKNYLRATQHRDLISILPDGSRVYLFHPWEKNIVRKAPRTGVDVPILDYLLRLEAIGEQVKDYEGIWYYF